MNQNSIQYSYDKESEEEEENLPAWTLIVTVVQVVLSIGCPQIAVRAPLLVYNNRIRTNNKSDEKEKRSNKRTIDQRTRMIARFCSCFSNGFN